MSWTLDLGSTTVLLSIDFSKSTASLSVQRRSSPFAAVLKSERCSQIINLSKEFSCTVRSVNILSSVTLGLSPLSAILTMPMTCM